MTSWDGGAHDHLQLAPLLAFWRRLATESNVGRLLEELLEQARTLTGAERGLILFRRGATITCEATAGGPGTPGASDTLPTQSAPGAPATFPSGGGPNQPRFSQSVLHRVLDTGEPVRAIDVAADVRLREQASVRRLGLRSVLAVPFPARDGRMGVLYLDSRGGGARFRDEDLQTLTVFAAQAALALALCRPEPAEAPPPIRPATPSRNQAGPRAHADPLAALVGGSSAVQRVIALVRQIAPTDLPVLIVGESGTGKELIARAIHRASGRASGPFVPENCAAIPESLIESELFGSVRGAYTGSDRDRDGLFRSADRGTLFLDEIGEMPVGLQPRLLRALQEREIRPVGSPRAFRVDVRILAATNRDPFAAIAQGRLRLDLYYRLAGITIEVPPLRTRREDIAPLALAILARRRSVRSIGPSTLSPGALAALSSYGWPGNVRELENEIERAAVLANAETIEAWDLSPRLTGHRPHDERDAQAPAERTMIEAALIAMDGRLAPAARSIGWSRQKLSRRMVTLGIPRYFGKSG